ncbi:mitochondrial K+-H+ exchange-related-domain-containing protein [Scheffersomyces amazonensis]|uniref:mitochondrial K+-H+ exchange-related-domain-containing protein n=1 Tax=Scheffersomyces amazonensis TaxID=1078765 RepID=UPI00315C536C
MSRFIGIHRTVVQSSTLKSQIKYKGFAPTLSCDCYLLSRRYQSTVGGNKNNNKNNINDIEDSTNEFKFKNPIDHNAIWVVSIPITTSRSYIYCHHKPSSLDKSQLKKFPLITKIESRLIGVATKGWNKISTSKISVNQRITKLIKQLLHTIPYEENCLKSFPSQQAMIREINEESLDIVHKKLRSGPSPNNSIVQTEIDDLKIPLDQLKPIPLYHPSFQNPTTILNQLYRFRDKEQSKHLKYAVLCAIGIPVTLPFALIPIIPNVPGFYLAYRLYCHIKALVGVKHLDYLLEIDESSSLNNNIKDEEEIGSQSETLTDLKDVIDTKHLTFQAIPQIDVCYRGEVIMNPDSIQEEEKVIIDEVTIEKLCDNMNLNHLKEDLLKSLSQESARLKKDIKVNDTVE